MTILNAMADQVIQQVQHMICCIILPQFMSLRIKQTVPGEFNRVQHDNNHICSHQENYHDTYEN